MGVLVEWIDSDTPETQGHKVFRDGFLIATVVGLGTQKFTDPDALDNVEYDYIVQAYTATGESTDEVLGVNWAVITVIPTPDPEYGIGNMSYEGIQWDPSAELETSLNGSAVTAGRLYLTGATSAFRYDLTNDSLDTPPVYANDAFAISNTVVGITVKPDGTDMIYARSNNDALKRPMVTPHSLVSCGTQTSQDLGAGVASIRGIVMARDGLSFFILDTNNNNIQQFTSATPWGALSTYSHYASFDLSGIDTGNWKGIDIALDNKTIIFGNNSTNFIHQLDMTAENDLATASLSANSFSVVGETPGMVNCIYNNACTKIFVNTGNNDVVIQYDLNN